MSVARLELRRGPGPGDGLHLYTEAGRGRGALDIFLVMPPAAPHERAAALAALHDVRTPLDLDPRLGRLAAVAPPGTAFLVAQGDDVWVCPSERVAARLVGEDGERWIEERQLLRLQVGERLELLEPGQEEPLGQLGHPPARKAGPSHRAVAGAVPVNVCEAPWRSVARTPRVRRGVGLAAGVLVLAVAAVFLLRNRDGANLPARVDAYRAADLEETILASVGERSRNAATERDSRGEEGGAQPASAERLPSTLTAEEQTAEAPGDALLLAGAAGREGWSFRASGPITSSPLLVGSQVLFGSRDSTLYCLDRESGAEAWRCPAGSGVGSSPRAAGELCVVGTYAGRVLGVNLATGAIVWEARTRGRVVSSPCLVGGRVIIGSDDRGVHAFELATGRPLWRLATRGAVRASAEALDPERVVIGSADGTLYCLAVSDGSVLWRRTLPAAIHATAAYDAASQRVVCGAQDGTVIACEGSSGRLLWRSRLDSEVNAQPRFAAGQVLIGTGRGKLHALDLVSGEPRWQVSAERGFDASPLVLDDVAVAPTYGGVLHLVDLADGSVRSRRDLGEEVFTSPTAGDGLVYLGTLGGTFHALALP